MTQQLKQPISPIVGEITGTAQRLYNWNGYGIVVGPGHNTHILDEIQYRRRHVKQNMILIVGAPGDGKSYYALRLAEILDAKFDPNMQIVFERAHLLNLIGPSSPLKMGQVILIDEAQFIAGARRWYEDIQKDVMEHIEAIRSKGFVVLIVALHQDLLDKIVRRFVLSQMVVMRARGQGTVYRVWTPAFADKMFRKRMGVMALKLPSVEQCEFPSCLLCKYKGKCLTNRAIYERRKKEFLDRMNVQSAKKAEDKERKKTRINYEQLIQVISNSSDTLVYKRNGNVEEESVKMVLESKGLDLPDAEVKKLVKRGLMQCPETFRKLKGGDKE